MPIRFGLSVGERVRTPYGVAEVAGAAYQRLWFRIGGSGANKGNSAAASSNSDEGKVWYFTPQQIVDGRVKKLFYRCTYATNHSSSSASTTSAAGGAVTGSEKEKDSSTANLPPSATNAALHYDVESISDLVDPSKWSADMDNLLVHFLVSQSDGRKSSSSGAVWKVSADQVCENFRPLQQQLSRLAMSNDALSHKWGISGPKRKAVLARLGLLRMFNQLLEMYLPFLVTDSANSGFLPDSKASDADDFTPLQVSLPTNKRDSVSSTHLRNLLVVRRSVITAGPALRFSWETDLGLNESETQAPTQAAKYNPQELFIGPLHAVRRRVFQHIKLTHFLEVLRSSVTKPAKTEDDYDYPDDLAHVKINRIKAFRAREAAELMHIPVLAFLALHLVSDIHRFLNSIFREKIYCCNQCSVSCGGNFVSTLPKSCASATPTRWTTDNHALSK